MFEIPIDVGLITNNSRVFKRSSPLCQRNAVIQNLIRAKGNLWQTEEITQTFNSKEPSNQILVHMQGSSIVKEILFDFSFEDEDDNNLAPDCI